jgi:hypothetical protein
MTERAVAPMFATGIWIACAKCRNRYVRSESILLKYPPVDFARNIRSRLRLQGVRPILESRRPKEACVHDATILGKAQAASSEWLPRFRPDTHSRHLDTGDEPGRARRVR